MTLQTIPVINKIFMTGFCPFPLKNFDQGMHMITVSVLAFKNVK